MIHYPPIEKGIYYGVDFPCKALTNDIEETCCGKEWEYVFEKFQDNLPTHRLRVWCSVCGRKP